VNVVDNSAFDAGNCRSPRLGWIRGPEAHPPVNPPCRRSPWTGPCLPPRNRWSPPPRWFRSPPVKVRALGRRRGQLRARCQDCWFRGSETCPARELALSANVVDNSAFDAGNCRSPRLGWKSGAGGTPFPRDLPHWRTLWTPSRSLSHGCAGCRGSGRRALGTYADSAPALSHPPREICPVGERCGQLHVRRRELSVLAARLELGGRRRARPRNPRCRRLLWTTLRSPPGTVGPRRYAGFRGPEACRSCCDPGPTGSSISGASGGTVRFWVDQPCTDDRPAEKPSGRSGGSGLASEV
jgi:hypothetical protein